MKTWVHTPVWVADRRLGNSGMRIAYHILYLSFFDNKTNSHTEIAYKPSDWAKELGMGKATVINSVKIMVDLGYISRHDSKIRPLETGIKIEPVLGIEIEPEYRNRTERVLKQNPKGIETEPEGIEIEPETPVYLRLTEGFATSVVFLKYYYSITTVDFVDLILIIEEIHTLEVFQMAREEKFPGEDRKKFVKNAKFIQSCEWIKDIYGSDDGSGDIPVDRYLLYVLLESMLTAKNPQGKFITAIGMLKNDGQRLPITWTKELAEMDSKSAAKASLRRMEQSTLRMVDDLDRPSEVKDPMAGPVDFLQVFKNKQREVR